MTYDFPASDTRGWELFFSGISSPRWSWFRLADVESLYIVILLGQSPSCTHAIYFRHAVKQGCLKKQRVSICKLNRFTVHDGDCGMKNQIFWEMTLCRFSYNYKHFTGVFASISGIVQERLLSKFKSADYLLSSTGFYSARIRTNLGWNMQLFFYIN